MLSKHTKASSLAKAHDFYNIVMQHYYRAFGLIWASDTRLPSFSEADRGIAAPDIVVTRRAILASRTGGTPLNNGAIFVDGVRFAQGGATFDMYDGVRIDWASPMPGGPPLAFYGTIVALALAWRGAVPLHASAVAIDGRAIAIAGPSGAGKSTLARALVAAGGQLISDDLSVLSTAHGVAPPCLWPGRPAIRVAPGAGDDADAADDAGKIAIRSRMVEPYRPVPIAALVLLRDRPAPRDTVARIDALHRQLFRPRWMRALPGQAARMATLLAAAPRMDFMMMPPACSAAGVQPDERALRLLAALRA